MLGQDLVPFVVGRQHLVEGEHRRGRVDHVELDGPRPGLGVGEAGLGVAPDAPGEFQVLGRDRFAVGPFQIGLQLDRDLHALAAIGQVDDLGRAVLHAGKLGAAQAGVLPVLVEGGDVPDGEAQRIGFDHLGIDIGVERRGELRDADGQLILGGLRRPGGHHQARNAQCGQCRPETHQSTSGVILGFAASPSGDTGPRLPALRARLPAGGYCHRFIQRNRRRSSTKCQPPRNEPRNTRRTCRKVMGEESVAAGKWNDTA